MPKWGKCSFEDFKKFQKNIDKLQWSESQAFMESCAKELAARLLAKVIKRTPVRKPENCPPGVKGGTLRRGWTGGKENMSDKGNVVGVGGKGGFTANMPIVKQGNNYVIEIKNPVEYASYVEFGHRTSNHKGWVRGEFMLTISEQEVEAAAPAVLERKLQNWLGEIFK